MIRRTRSCRRWLVLAVVGGMLTAAVGTGCRQREAPPPGGSTSSKARRARDQAETATVAAVTAAAQAQVTAHPSLDRTGETFAVAVHVPPAPEPAAPPAPPTPGHQTPSPKAAAPEDTPKRPSGPALIREQVASGIPYPTEAEAEQDALRQAADRIAQKLGELDPPILFWPSPSVVKNEYVRKDSRVVRPPTDEERELLKEHGYGDRVYVEYTVELTAEQVRGLRTHNRVGFALRVLGIFTAVALAGLMFFRIDDWTKGYLTSWLMVVAVALGGGAVVALVLV